MLDVLVDALAGLFGIRLGDSVDVDPKDIYEVIVGVTTTGTSVLTLRDP